MKRSQQGFTLIEIMIVIAIVSILAAIAVSMFQDYVTRAKLSEAFSVASGLKARIVESYALEKQCPLNTGGNSNDNGIYPPADYATNTIEKIEIASGVSGCDINIFTRSTGLLASSARGKVISLQLSQTSGAFSWDCVSDMPVDAIGKYLPRICHP